MITGFEKITKELTEYEIKKTLPILIKSLIRLKGKDRTVTNKAMVAGLKTIGIKTSEPRIRKMINYIRLSGEVINLISTSKGYYVSTDNQELLDYVESLHQRADAIYNIAKAIDFQRKTLILKSLKK